ncbi:MAG TPA: RidA family protein [Candidatus Acidoferrales bacterium]|nr:RidA family protein [Candidatus Acidoferrales bacterium]
MPKRKVITAGLPHHRNPIPTAIRIGSMVFTSAVGGQDPVTHETPEDPEKQVENCFKTIRRIMEEAGGTTDDIAKMTVYLKDMKYREYVNREWLKMFPDENDRPVRHAMKADLAGSNVIQIEVTAVL